MDGSGSQTATCTVLHLIYIQGRWTRKRRGRFSADLEVFMVDIRDFMGLEWLGKLLI